MVYNKGMGTLTSSYSYILTTEEIAMVVVHAFKCIIILYEWWYLLTYMVVTQIS